jgi:hypothetical protein
MKKRAVIPAKAGIQGNFDMTKIPSRQDLLNDFT